MPDEELVEIMMQAVFDMLKLEGLIENDPDTPLVKEVMQAIIDAQREAGALK